MPPLPRGICTVCGNSVAVRTGGEIREHRADPKVEKVCPGSGKPGKASK